MTLGLRSLKALYFVFHNLGDFWLSLFYFVCPLPDLRHCLSDRITRIASEFPRKINAESKQFHWKSWFNQRRHSRRFHLTLCFVFLDSRAKVEEKLQWVESFLSLSELDANLVDEKVSCASAQSTSVSRFIDLWNAVEVVTKTVQAGHNFLERKLKGNSREKLKSGLGNDKFSWVESWVLWNWMECRLEIDGNTKLQKLRKFVMCQGWKINFCYRKSESFHSRVGKIVSETEYENF